MSRMPPGTADPDRVFVALEGTGAERAEVTASWHRCLVEHHVNPNAIQAPQILTAEELKDSRAPVEDLISVAQEENDRLHATVGKVGYVVLLTSPRGVVVDVRGDPSRVDEFAHWGVWKGGVWAEEVEGTNGIGTCIAEQRPVTVHRSQHFRARHANLSCCGAPLFDPFGKFAGVLDVSSVDPELSDRSHALAFAVTVEAARAIEERLFRQTFGRGWILAVAIPGRGSEALMLAVDSDQRIVGADRTARSVLGLGEARLAGDLSLWQFFARSTVAFRARNDDLLFPLTRGGDGQAWQALITPPIKNAASVRAASLHTRPRIGPESPIFRTSVDPRSSGVVPMSLEGDASLSARERLVLELIGQGQSNKEIARALEISPETVKSHMKNMFAKLDVERRAQAIYRAKNLGLIP